MLSGLQKKADSWKVGVKRESGICLPHKITKDWQIVKIIYGFLQVMVGPFPVRHKNYQNVSPMKSENALKTKNPPEEKILRRIISLFLVMMELLISNRARR